MGKTEQLKLVFMGTPAMAAAVLGHLLHWEGGCVLAAYCQPDKPAGRGLNLTVPPVKALALERGIPVHQPPDFRNPADVSLLRAYQPDYLLVLAYGLILPQAVLDIPRAHPLNAHASLLPRYRGAAPIQRALMNDDKETGVSIMRMEAGLDTGPIVLREAVTITPDDSMQSLSGRLTDLCAPLFVSAIEGLQQGRLLPVPQNQSLATYAAKITKRDCCLDFSQSVKRVYAQYRGISPAPGAYAVLRRECGEPFPVRIPVAYPLEEGKTASLLREFPSLSPGQILPRLVESALAVRCADGFYLIRSLRPASRKSMDAAAFVNGYCRGQESPRFILADPAENGGQ
ncbi:methionyl-tRNA formyltransferase [Deltaproteobacteria bacterium]|nr:methionyl-tRNA formyltransferase [Deltaproteobacteria bacterium]